MSVSNNGPAGSPRLLRPEPVSSEPVSSVPVWSSPEQQASAVPIEQPTQVAEPAVMLDPPTMGLPALWWRIKHRISPNAKPPKFSKKEADLRRQQAENEAAAQLQAARHSRRIATIERMRAHSDQVPSFTTCFIGVKGASATTTTMVNTTTCLSDTTRTTVYAADFNPASGSAGSRLGKNHDETISLREFGKLVEALDGDSILTRQQVNARLRPTRFGVRVLNADDYTLETTEQFGTKTIKVLKVLKENCDYLMCDTANDITTAASKAVLEAADVLVFTANVNERDSLRMLYTSMEKVRQLGLGDKVSDSIVVISNIPEGGDVKDYLLYLNRVNLDHEVIQRISEGDFHGPFLGVPHDPVIARAGEVDPASYNWDTSQSYVDIVNAIFEQFIRIRKIDLSTKSVVTLKPKE